MPYTMADFERWYVKEQFAKLTPQEQQEALEKLPMEARLAGLSAEQIQAYLDQLKASDKEPTRKSSRPRKR